MSYKRSRTDFEADRPGQSKHPLPPYVFYGTALPPLDSQSRDDGTYVPVWQQEVRDERGRKRLHGAFTGGFSAGYFNTVGSKEGWTPSAFVSSRANRQKDEAKTTEQRAEDFMDDEDLADLEETRKLQTRSDFAALGADHADGRRNDLLSQVFRTHENTMGVKLLQRMGWKPGQGLGPKIKRQAREEGGSTGDAAAHLFAPEDVPMVSFNKKSDHYGIGWSGENRLETAGSTTRSRTAKTIHSDSDSDGDAPFSVRKPSRNPKKAKSSFGVGVLNDTGSDDEDPYEIGPKISYTKIIGGDKKKRKAGLVANASSAKTVPQPIFQSRKLTAKSGTSDFRRCHDGRLPLDGFVLATQALTLDNSAKFTTPPVPPDWTPALAQSENTNAYQSSADAAKSSTLDPKSRASLLGEDSLPGKSIFDFISPSARNKLASTTGANLPQGKGEGAPAGFEQSPAERQRTLWDLVPRLEPSVARAALERGATGWMPYAEDLGKRGRYRVFLESMAGDRPGLPDRKEGSSTDDWVNEMREFAQAAMVFKPVSGLMASRFTTAKAANHGPKNASDALSTPHPRDGGLTVAPQPEAKKADPAEDAARLGMFGIMTRSRADFYPTRLTCKRFGVKPPAHVLNGPEAADSADKARTEVVSQAKMDAMMREAASSALDSPAGNGVAPSDGAAPSAGPDEQWTLPARQPAPVVDPEINQALESQRAGEELFKAIFGSDDEDD